MDLLRDDFLGILLPILGLSSVIFIDGLLGLHGVELDIEHLLGKLLFLGELLVVDVNLFLHLLNVVLQLLVLLSFSFELLLLVVGLSETSSIKFLHNFNVLLLKLPFFNENFFNLNLGHSNLSLKIIFLALLDVYFNLELLVLALHVHGLLAGILDQVLVLESTDLLLQLPALLKDFFVKFFELISELLLLLVLLLVQIVLLGSELSALLDLTVSHEVALLQSCKFLDQLLSIFNQLSFSVLIIVKNVLVLFNPLLVFILVLLKGVLLSLPLGVPLNDQVGLLLVDLDFTLDFLVHRLQSLFPGILFVIEFVLKSQEMLVQGNSVAKQSLVTGRLVFLINFAILEHLDLTLHDGDLSLEQESVGLVELSLIPIAV